MSKLDKYWRGEWLWKVNLLKLYPLSQRFFINCSQLIIMKKLFILILGFILFACGNKREEELNLREQVLAEKEAALLARESECDALQRLRDSLYAAKAQVIDSVEVIRSWPDSLKVQWNARIICRESACSRYVIGDQRNETWKFVSDSTGIYTDVSSNNKLLRRFRARFVEDRIVLFYVGDSTASGRTRINVILDEVKPNVIKGTQTIIGQDNCPAKFSVELVPSKKN
jgi:hypothetical protein